MEANLTVKVVAQGYIDLAETKDPVLCTRILSLILTEAKPETAEQRLVRELEEKAEKASDRAILAEDRTRKLEKELADLKKSLAAVATEQKPAPQFINGG